MANVRRFIIPSAYLAHQDVDIANLGVFAQGVFDVDVNNTALITQISAAAGLYGIVDLSVINTSNTTQLIIVAPNGSVASDTAVATQVNSGTATQAALKTVIDAEGLALGWGSGAVSDTAVAAQVSSGTATQAALKAAYASTGPTDPGPSLPHGTEYVWMKTDGSGNLLDILAGVA